MLEDAEKQPKEGKPGASKSKGKQLAQAAEGAEAPPEETPLFTAHSVYTFSFVSEISTCSVVSLVHSCYLRKFHFFAFYLRKFHFSTFYLRKFHVSYFISESCVLQITPAFILQLFSLIMFPHTGMQLYLLTMSFVPQPTNKQTFRHKADSN